MEKKKAYETLRAALARLGQVVDTDAGALFARLGLVLAAAALYYQPSAAELAGRAARAGHELGLFMMSVLFIALMLPPVAALGLALLRLAFELLALVDQLLFAWPRRLLQPRAGPVGAFFFALALEAAVLGAAVIWLRPYFRAPAPITVGAGVSAERLEEIRKRPPRRR